MPFVDLVDETFVVAPPRRLAAIFADARSWPRWWPTLALELAEDRGTEGVRWRVVGAGADQKYPMRGTSEVWLESVKDGTVVHFYLRADPLFELPRSPVRQRRLADRLRRSHALAFKQRLHAVKDELEAGRAPGERPAAGGATPLRASPPATEPVDDVGATPRHW